MIKIKETTTKTITVKNIYMSGENVLLDENGNAVNIYDVFRKAYGDGVEFEVKATVKTDTES